MSIKVWNSNLLKCQYDFIVEMISSHSDMKSVAIVDKYYRAL